MAKFKDKKFYNDKNAYPTPPLPDSTTTKSSFEEKTPVPSTNMSTPFEKTRSYDVTLDKIEINVKGAAPIFGEYTPAQLMSFPNEMAQHTSALNNIYFYDRLAVLSTVRRNIEINYQGMDTSIGIVDGGQYATATTGAPASIDGYLAHDLWVQHCSRLETEIKSAMYTNLDIFNYQYGSPINYDVTSSSTNDSWASRDTQYKVPFSGYVNSKRSKHTNFSYLMLQYQTEILYPLILVYYFEQLVTQLPKLQELYFNSRDYFLYIQNALKQTRFTAVVKNILTWLKSRFIDVEFFKTFILPTLICSKETDGINSPINYLLATSTVSLDFVYDVTQPTPQTKAATAQMITTFGLQGINFQLSTPPTSDPASTTYLPCVKYDGMNPGSDQRDDHLIKRSYDSFSIDTILDIIISNPNFDQFKIAIDAWMKRAENRLKDTMNEAIVFASKPIIISIESLLAKMATQPKGIFWQQNLEVSSLPPLFKYSNWDLVNELVYFQGGPVLYYENGSMRNLPMYRRTGIPKTFIYEYSQNMVGVSDNMNIAFFTLGDTVYIRTRKNRLYTLQARTFTEPVSGLEIGCFYSTNITLSDAYLVLQDKINAVLTTKTGSNGWINPNLMSALTVTYKNKWADVALWLAKNFIIPLA